MDLIHFYIHLLNTVYVLFKINCVRIVCDIRYIKLLNISLCLNKMRLARIHYVDRHFILFLFVIALNTCILGIMLILDGATKHRVRGCPRCKGRGIYYIETPNITSSTTYIYFTSSLVVINTPPPACFISR